MVYRTEIGKGRFAVICLTLIWLRNAISMNSIVLAKAAEVWVSVLITKGVEVDPVLSRSGQPFTRLGENVSFKTKI